MTLLETILDQQISEVKIRIYVKKLGQDGVMATEWERIDNLKNKNRISNIGTITQVMNESYMLLEDLKVGTVQIKFINDDGAFSEEENHYSFFYGYFLFGSLIKIETYHVIDVIEYGGRVFEGIIDDFECVIGGESTITASDYITFLNKDIDSLKYDAEKNPSGIFTDGTSFAFEDFFNHLITHAGIESYIDVTVNDKELSDFGIDGDKTRFIGYNFSGSVLNVINEAQKNSLVKVIFYQNNNYLYITTSMLLDSHGAVHSIYGDGQRRPSQIQKINKLSFNYDKVISRAIDSNTKYSVDSSLTHRRYREKIINTKNLAFDTLYESQRVDILEKTLEKLETNKKTIEFEISYAGSSIQLDDQVIIYQKSVLVSQNGILSYYDIDKFNSGAVYSSLVYGINLGSDSVFLVYKIVHDLNAFKTKIYGKEL